MEDEFKIVASLDIPNSADRINKVDIPDLEKRLKPIQILAELDTKSVSNIQTQLNTLTNQAKAPTVKIGIDTSGLNSVQSATQNITNSLQTVQTQAQQTASAVSNVTNTSSLLEAFKKSLANMNMTSDGIDNVANRINNLNVEITSLNQSMSVNEKTGKRMLSVDISGTDKLGNAVKLTQQYNLETGDLVKTIDSLSSATQKSGSQLDNLMAQQIKRKADLKNQVEQIYKTAIDPNASRSITNGQNLDTLKAKYDEIKLAIDGMDGKSKTAFAQQEADISKLISNLKVVINQYKNAENVSTTLKPDKLASAISKAESQFQVLNTNIQNAGVSSDKLTQNVQTISSVLGKTQNGGVINKAEIEQVFTALSNARNELEALIKMKTSDSAIERVRIQAETLVSSLNTFANNNVGFDKFTTTVNGAVVSVDSLKQSLATVNSQSDLSIIRSQITALETAFRETAVDSDKYVTQINSAITTLQSLANSPTFAKNASNPQVTQTKQDINSLITAYQNLMTKLQGNITPAGLETVRTELTQLNARFNDTTATAQRFESELKNDNGAEKLAQRVALLKAQLTALAKANPKALKRFGNEINSLMATLNNSPDGKAVEQVAKDIQILRKEINNADLAGKTFFQKLKDNASKFTGWMSMTYAISLFTRSVREAVVELKDIDTILTEISKTSDRTTESLKKLGETSFATASKYGQKASDYLLGVQEMSRAGFGEKESEQMAELSTLAQSAGDMTAELANEYLIATNAGYQFGGSAEKLNAVLNSQNYITNRNALNMSELAEATKIVASQAAQSGIGIDEMTAAVGTMIATTQQGGEVAARALKGILMNLQAVKGTAEDIGDGGEDITDESLTKYEKACLDLGVALKEVKNGVLQLRDPMVILEELANAVSKEAEGSIKVANLVSAIGGKYRGGQLLSLLRNWETYSKMLSEFNSNEAENSAFDEAMKSAESWEGKLNELSNTWTDFVNGLVTSDTAKDVIDFLTTIIKNIDRLRDSIGTIPTLLGSIATVGAIKNVGELLNTPVYAQPQLICA